MPNRATFSKEADKLLADNDVIAQTDLDTLKTMLTYCVRGERFFSDGLRAILLEHGRVQTLLHRLQLLQDRGELFSKKAGVMWFMQWQHETLLNWNWVIGWAEFLQSEQSGPLTNEQREALDRILHFSQTAVTQWSERNRIAPYLFGRPLDEYPPEKP